MRTLYWISLSYATFGLEVTDDHVTMAPPIARWTLGKTDGQVLTYYFRKGAKVVRVR